MWTVYFGTAKALDVKWWNSDEEQE